MGRKFFSARAAVREVVTGNFITHYPSLTRKHLRGCLWCDDGEPDCMITRATTHANPTTEEMMEGSTNVRIAFGHETTLIKWLTEVNVASRLGSNC
ncbi:Beta-1,3-galactosyltransferase 5 [Phytophthora palmivora]|uniref:Beta-1,3-galactosyltransferase 5 n=1 Tax=Phytophthora palmivora TaxID=4796 RepID=A0A2P4X9E9_9STRA|nr:Beta-1,3-galactosyltransferase 5 [Phytophthora palmivora]